MGAIAQEIGGPQCHALNLSDAQRCDQATANEDNLFCRFHAKQCFGLYMGYKRRNAELDALAAREPAFLRNTKKSLVSQTFEDIQTEAELQEVHNYLFKQYVLLGKVISARNLHHRHFYSLEMDYGHKVYLDKLVQTRHTVTKALESLERRTAQILYRREKWFEWVREVQDDQDTNREKEQKKIKLEAALFKRHWREMEDRLKAAREKEEKRRQEAYLEEVWKERMQQRLDSGEETDSGEDFDPIDDVYEDDRARYIHLIRHFLWMGDGQGDEKEKEDVLPGLESTKGTVEEAVTEKAKGENGVGHGGGGAEKGAGKGAPGKVDEATATPGQAGKKKKKGGKKKKAGSSDVVMGNTGSNAPPSLVSAGKANQVTQREAAREPDKGMIESREDIRKRLKEGVEKDYSHVDGPLLVGTAHNPPELFKRTAPVKDEDISKLIAEITEIKLLLFCRQLLAHSKLLPAGLRAKNIDEFLADPSVSDSDLRDLCLQVEKPSLQALRDACADYFRTDEPDNDDDEDHEEDEIEKSRTAYDYIRQHARYGDLDDSYLHYSLLSRMSRDALSETTKLLEGVDDDKEMMNKKMKVTICGRSIWNYAASQRMARDGWLHFSILAKDRSFDDAIALCRNWDEFFELNILAIWQYFPASKWTGWSGNFLTEELTQMGFVPFFMDLSAAQQTTYNQMNSVSRKLVRKQQTIVEARNFVCAHMKRNDPVTRRFIQYVLMRPGEHFILVRDGKNGRIVTAPEEQHRWLVRSRPGNSRFKPGTVDVTHSAENGWNVELEVDGGFFEMAREERSWHFGFNSYYEIYIWDFAPGREAIDMYHNILRQLMTAHQVRGCRDKYKHMKPIMETLAREPDTKRIRQVKPGEKSLYDELSGPDAEFWIRTSKGEMIRNKDDNPPETIGRYSYYNDTDAAEDAILFEEELKQGVPENMPFVEISNPIQMLEATRMPLSVLNRKANRIAPLLEEITKGPKLPEPGRRPAIIRRGGPFRKYRLLDDDVSIHSDDEFYLEGELDAEGYLEYERKQIEDGKPRSTKVETGHEEDSEEDWDDQDDDDEDSFDDLDSIHEGDDGTGKTPYTPGQDEFPFKAPPVWEQQHNIIASSIWDADRKALLQRLDFSSVQLKVSTKKISQLKGSQEIMERDRGYIFKDTFHLGDLEPGAQERYKESQELIISLQKYESPFPQQHQWAWFCMQVLDWMKLKLTYDDYNPDVHNPWPHRYILQDIVQAFMTMGLFFPNLPVTSVVQEFLNSSEEGKKFRDSKIFDKAWRGQQVPDIRKRTSCSSRPKQFWEEWEKVYTGDAHFVDAIPFDWNMAIRPTIAKLYRAGIIGPAVLEAHPDVVPGFAVANTEPHRPEKLDLFINYSNVNFFLKGMPPQAIEYKDWPDLLATARRFVSSRQFPLDKPPRFALLRLWSAPHYYPLMMMVPMRQHVSFIDPVGRAWEFKFIPKDMPRSEWSLHNSTMLRLGFLREQLGGFQAPMNRPKLYKEGKFGAAEKWAHGTSELDERVAHRGDLVLVMGEGEEDLLKWCVAVTFALQTKPWLREVDLWKSFVNVGLPELEALNEYWLD
ncbi:hypothetical protein V8F20_012427 [Naviculisporaceae sp. PSN 640]